MSKMFDQIARVARGELPQPPIAELLGFALTEVEPGRAVIEFTAGGRHANPLGTLHGGVLCDIADAAMGWAYMTTLGEGESYTTLEIKTNFLRPVRAGRLAARARVRNAGRTIGLVECDVTTEDGKVAAYAVSTCMALRGEPAQGR